MISLKQTFRKFKHFLFTTLRSSQTLVEKVYVTHYYFIIISLFYFFIYLFIFFFAVPLYGPYLYDKKINLREYSVYFRLEPLDTIDAQGKLLGYRIAYFLENTPNKTLTMVISKNATEFLLIDLEEGTYVISIAGFTRKGTGPYSHYSAICE